MEVKSFEIKSSLMKAAGKSISEDDNRWMMDLIDVSQPSIPAGSWKFFLVCVNPQIATVVTNSNRHTFFIVY